MIRRFLPVLLTAMLLTACESKELVEDASSDCICKAWAGPADTTGLLAAKAFDALDAYLLRNGYLGKGTLADYKRFALDTGLIIIPADADSIRLLALAVESGYAGAPDTRALGACVDSMYNHTRSLDTNSALHRLANSLHALSQSGAPDWPAFYEDYFRYVTEKDWEKPVYRYYYYLFVNRHIEIGRAPGI